MTNLYFILASTALLCMAVTWLGVLKGSVIKLLPLLLACIASVGSVIAWQFTENWNSGFSESLWLSVGCTLLFFLALITVSSNGEGLAVLLLPYLFILCLLALLFYSEDQVLAGMINPTKWVWAHIAFSVSTYSLVTLAAIAGVSAALRERNLKLKKQRGFVDVLPTLSQSEQIETRLLRVSLLFIIFGILTGLSAEYIAHGNFIVFDHKTIFVFLALIVLGVMEAFRVVIGLRGRRAARLVLLIWLFLTLAYPGVKLVHHSFGTA
jgi:ABC-type uncharacterized transport system permease subunit